MKAILGIALIIIGATVGVYVGVWLLFIGGIVDAVNLFKGINPVTGLSVAITILKIVCAPVGWVIVTLISGFGIVLVKE
jgi:hypothetical protein